MTASPKRPPWSRRHFLKVSAGGLASLGLVDGLAGCTENGPPPALRVIVLDDDVLRLQFAPSDAPWPGPGPEHIIVKSDEAWPNPPPIEATPEVVRTARLRVDIRRAPFALQVSTSDGATLLADFVVDPAARRASWVLPADEHVFGFGDQRAPLDKRGTAFSVRASDTDFHSGDPFATYKAVPFLLSSRGYGLYVHSTWRSHFHLDAGLHRASVELDSGHLDLFIFLGPAHADVLTKYTALTGRPALLPRWAFGFHQGGARNDTSEAWADGIGASMRAADLPVDVVYYDDWDAETFSASFVSRMWDQHHLKISAGLGMPVAVVDTPLWDALAALEPPGLVTDARGEIVRYTGYGLGEPMAEVDFFSDEAADVVFTDTFRGPIDAGVKCGMFDFGELSFVPRSGTARFPSFQAPARSVDELRNVYGLVYAEQLARRAAARAGGRMVGMPRAGGAGSQRVGWTWTADSSATWSDPGGLGGLREHLRAVLGLCNSGFSSVGFDIGGWAGVASDQLYLRWFQAGMFLPYASAHGHGDHSVLARPPAFVALCRAALKRRYRLLPYLYSLHVEAHRTGVPMVRSLALATDSAPGTEVVDDAWYLGPWLLVAPVVHGLDEVTSATARDVVLPKGEWLDLGDGVTLYEGPTILRNYPAPLDVVPLFALAGAIVPLGPALSYALEVPSGPHVLTFVLVPSTAASCWNLVEDDGEFGLEQGRYSERTLRLVREQEVTRVTLEARDDHGGFAPAARDLELLIHRQVVEPTLVRQDGIALPQRDAAFLDGGGTGWAYDGATKRVRIRVPEPGMQVEFLIA